MREEQRNYIKELYLQIKSAEEQMRDKPMPELTEEDFFLFHETGNRLVYENVYFGRRKYLTVYAILAMWSSKLAGRGIIDRDKDEKMEATAEEGYIERLGEILIQICREQFWALPAHVDFDRINNPETRFTIDLFAAETAQALSEIALQLYDRLPVDIVACVAREVIERVLQPFAASAVPYSWWETDRCNWSAVCAGSVGMTAMNLDALNRKLMSDHMPDTGEKDSPVCLDILLYRDYYDRLPANWKANCLNRVCDALGCYLDGMEQDGACTEGLGYYNYGMSFYAAFAEAYDAEHSRRQKSGQLMYRDKCEQIALFQQKCYFTSRVGNGVSISFSDGSRHESFLPGLTAYLKHCYPQVQTPDYTLARPFDEDACYRYLTNERNISWLMKYADADSGLDQNEKQRHTNTLTAYLLWAAQWLICQDENGNGFAAKGGNNNENHNHNDIGHFLCVFNGRMLLADLGAGEYTRDYFGNKRYGILCNRSFGHSVPIINGMEQCAGKEYHADSFAWDEKEHMLTMELAGAYPKGCIHSLVRRIKMVSPETMESGSTQNKVKMQIEVEDLFTASKDTFSIAENLITEYETIIQKGALTIQDREKTCYCRIELEINGKTAADNRIDRIPCIHKDHSGESQNVYRIVWNVDVDKCGNARCKMWITFYENDVNS